MIPHNMTLFKFICVQYQFHRQTLPIMKIDRGQIQFRDYVSTGTEPNRRFVGFFNVPVQAHLRGQPFTGQLSSFQIKTCCRAPNAKGS